jgi:hypothetical protein
VLFQKEKNELKDNNKKNIRGRVEEKRKKRKWRLGQQN